MGLDTPIVLIVNNGYHTLCVSTHEVSLQANMLSSMGSMFARMKLKEIDGGLHERVV